MLAPHKLTSVHVLSFFSLHIPGKPIHVKPVTGLRQLRRKRMFRDTCTTNGTVRTICWKTRTPNHSSASTASLPFFLPYIIFHFLRTQNHSLQTRRPLGLILLSKRDTPPCNARIQALRLYSLSTLSTDTAGAISQPTAFSSHCSFWDKQKAVQRFLLSPKFLTRTGAMHTSSMLSFPISEYIQSPTTVI